MFLGGVGDASNAEGGVGAGIGGEGRVGIGDALGCGAGWSTAGGGADCAWRVAFERQ